MQMLIYRFICHSSQCFSLMLLVITSNMSIPSPANPPLSVSCPPSPPLPSPPPLPNPRPYPGTAITHPIACVGRQLLACSVRHSPAAQSCSELLGRRPARPSSRPAVLWYGQVSVEVSIPSSPTSHRVYPVYPVTAIYSHRLHTHSLSSPHAHAHTELHRACVQCRRRLRVAADHRFLLQAETAAGRMAREGLCLASICLEIA